MTGTIDATLGRIVTVRGWATVREVAEAVWRALIRIHAEAGLEYDLASLGYRTPYLHELQQAGAQGITFRIHGEHGDLLFLVPLVPVNEYTEDFLNDLHNMLTLGMI